MAMTLKVSFRLSSEAASRLRLARDARGLTSLHDAARQILTEALLLSQSGELPPLVVAALIEMDSKLAAALDAVLEVAAEVRITKDQVAALGGAPGGERW